MGEGSNDLVATTNGTERSAADVQCTLMRSVTSATGAAPTREVLDTSGSDRDEIVNNGFCRADYLPMITFREDWVALLDAAKGDALGFASLDGF